MASADKIAELESKARRIRRLAIEAIGRAQAGHPGGSLSAADILACLYFEVLKVRPAHPDWEDRDRFILSKGHAAPALYAALAEAGFFSWRLLHTFDCIDSILQAHPDIRTPGVDMSSGSLGQGLSVAVGMALGARLRNKQFRVYALLGDGEIQEGQIWEAAMSAAKFRLDNLTAIIDYNHIQLAGTIEETMPVEPLADKWLAFNWDVQQINGHSIVEVLSALERAKSTRGRPSMIIAETVKGKGVSFMEDTATWHARAPNAEELRQSLAELDSG